MNSKSLTVFNSSGSDTFNINAQNSENNIIHNYSGGKVDVLIIATPKDTPLDAFSFDTTKYSLFVVDNLYKDMYEFSINNDSVLIHSKNLLPLGKASKKSIIDTKKYPAIIVQRNYKNLFQQPNAEALLCKVYSCEFHDHCITFHYHVSKRFNAQFLNTNPELFGILHSEQHNEIDESKWELKEIDIIKALNLEGEL